MENEELVVIGSGPSGRLSAIKQALGSMLSLRTMPDLEEDDAEDGARKKPRKKAPRLVQNDVIDIGWHILPGPSLQLDEPQTRQDVKPTRKIPEDIPCAESRASLPQRLQRVRRLRGTYSLIFR